MQAESALQAFAEVAVGVAGFSAVIVALRPSSDIDDERRWKWGLAAVFCWSLGALFFSFLPFIVVHSSVPEPTTWRACLFGMAAFVGVAGASFTVADIRMNRLGVGMGGLRSKGTAPTSVHMVIARLVYAVASIALLASAVLFARPGPYLAGLATMLAISLWTLLYFFFSNSSPRNAA